MCCCACRRRAIPSPSSACATSSSIPRPMLGDYTLPLDPGPRARFAGFTTEGDLAFDADHVGVLARFRRGELYDRRKVDDLREAMVSTRLFSTVSAEPVLTGETRRGRHPICQHPRPPGRRPGPLARRLAPATAPARASGSKAPGSIATCSRPKARCASPRSPAPPEQNLSHPLPPQQLGPARPRPAAPVRGRRGAISRPSRAIRPGSTASIIARIDADLAEALDLCLWRRDPRHQREPQRQRRRSRSPTPISSAG